MRQWSCISIALLAAIPLATPAQLPFHRPHTESFTLLDALSADTDYVSLIKLLQRAKLVPTLNKLNGSTLFAPTNDAISRHAATNELWRSALDDSTIDLHDNLQLRLRHELFYHLLNYSLPDLPTEQTPQVHKTLLYPTDTTEPPSHEPPPSPPWMPIPNGTLGSEPQRLRLSARDSEIWAGVDASGNNGIKLVKDRVDASNGVLLGVDEVIEMPSDLATVISRQPELSYFSRVLTPDLAKFLNSTPTLTVFLPVDDAWHALPRLERIYLESEFAADDLTRILNMHAVLLDKVQYSDSFESDTKLRTIDGQDLKLRKEDEGTKVSGADLLQPDIYASNGVLHTISSLLVPRGALQITPEKYLLALNCTEFVSLIHSVNLTSLINDTETSYTILAPRDDVLKLFADPDLPHRGSEELKRYLQYHFIPGKLTEEKLKDGMLVETALEEVGLSGHRQVMPVEVTGKAKDPSSIRFAGASVLGKPEDANNTLIYFISRPIVPPLDAMETALPSLELSSFLAAIFSTNLADVIKTSPRTTLLLPPNSAFRRLGTLVSGHLLSSSAKADLERVIRHHALSGVEYSAGLVSGSQRTFSTLEGSDVHIERRGPNDTIVFTSSGGWADMQSELYPRDMLTQTGVIHEVSDILIPRSVELTIGKLVKAAKGTTMASMVVKAGMEWILNGTAPPENSTFGGYKGTGWTVLCPTDDAFKSIDLAELYEDEDLLRSIVYQHIVLPPASTTAPPDTGSLITDNLNNNRPLALDDSRTYQTLQSKADIDNDGFGELIVLVQDGATVIGVNHASGKVGREESANVLGWGRATIGSGTGGVVQIDRVLMPYHPPWQIKYGQPAAVGVLGLVLIGAFFWGVRYVWRKDTTEATYEPVGGFTQDDDESS